MLNVGVIGGGKFGVVHLNAFKQLEYAGVARLAAICRQNADELSKQTAAYGAKGYTDYLELINDPEIDAVSVVTPDHMHRPMAVAAAKAGKHILCEKPLDVTVDGCAEMIAAAREAGVLLQVDFHKRYDPDHLAMARNLQAGQIGDILYGQVYMEDRIEVPADWFPHWAGQSSPCWFLGVHFIDLVLWSTKLTPDKVFATGKKGILKEGYGIDAWDSISFKVIMTNGASFHFDVSWILPRGFEAIVNQAIRIVGTRGVWEVDSQYRGTRSCDVQDGMRSWNNNFMRESVDKLGRTIYRGYGVESIEDFAYNVQRLKSGGTLADLGSTWASGEDGQKVTAVAEAVHKSIASGQVIDVQRV